MLSPTLNVNEASQGLLPGQVPHSSQDMTGNCASVSIDGKNGLIDITGMNVETQAWLRAGTGLGRWMSSMDLLKEELSEKKQEILKILARANSLSVENAKMK